MFIALLSLAATSGYKSLLVSDASILPVCNFLQRAVSILFPDVREAPEFLSAERFLGAKGRFRFSIRIRRVFCLIIVVKLRSAARSPIIVSIQHLGFKPTLINSYRWCDAAALSSEWIYEFEAALREQVGFTGQIAHILAVRKQIDAGQNQHLIFLDDDEQLWAAIVHANVAGDRRVMYCERGN
jgi:hypothetical protein